MAYFDQNRIDFSLLRAGDMPLRKAQLGAMHGLGSHFSKSMDPALVVLPTGVGKTAVAQATPFVLEGVRRALVVVPSRVLRSDTTQRFGSLTELKKTSIVPQELDCPSVHEITSRPTTWDFAEDYDVIVATPQSASPGLLKSAGLPEPDPSLFDIIIVDEGHHVPAKTWTALIDHFPEAKKVLLTATPYRRDRKDILGAIAYEYPLETAVTDGAYAQISLVPVEAAGADPETRDQLIAAKAVERLRSPEHADSAVLIRTESRQRAEDVGKLYEALGVMTTVVHSGLTARTVRKRLDSLRAGEIEAVSFVGILGEGFDHPALRIGAYHDKHKSLPATLQFIGRLARQTPDSATQSEVVTVVEDLEADTWQLYQHDAVWEELIPELADKATQEVVARKVLVSHLPDPPDQLSLHEVEPKRKAVVYELPTAQWTEPFSDDDLVSLGLTEGARFGSGRIFYVAADPVERLIIIITAHDEHPPWMRTRSFDAVTYQLHTAVAEPSALSTGQHITYLFVSSSTRTNERNLANLVGNGCEPRVADPDVINRCMEGFDFEKYQGVGLRAVGQKGAGRASYRSLLGSGVDAAVQAADTRGHRLGHAMGTAAKALGRPRSTAGVSTVNARIFENSYAAISSYVEWVGALARMIRGSTSVGTSVPLIPSLRYETRLQTWPPAEVLGAELPAEAYTAGLDIEGGPPLNRVNIKASIEGSEAELRITYEGSQLWVGRQQLAGTIVTVGPDPYLKQGFMVAGTLGGFMQEYSPTIFFADGSVVTGTRLAPPANELALMDRTIPKALAWRGVDIRKELRTDGSGQPSVQDYCERILLRKRDRFVVLDDASGELADYVTLELADGTAELVFVHCKASSKPQPGLRLEDLMEVLDQCRRSARWIQQGKTLWDELARRLDHRPSTQVLSAGGFDDAHLKALCQRLAVNPPRVQATVVAAQPGLDVEKLLAASGSGQPGSQGQAAIETVMHAASLIQSAAIRFTVLGS